MVVMLQGCNDNLMAGLIRRGQLLLTNNLSLAGFFCKDISGFVSKSGSNDLSVNSIIGRMPGRYNLLKAMLKKARVCVNSASGTLYLSVRLVQHLNHSLYGYELV